MRICSLLFISIFSALVCDAGVNLKNGNFYISYTDINFDNHPLNFSITRTYNSKAINKGWFGMGWGSMYETYLTVQPGGCVTVHHHAAGSVELQEPKETNQQEIASGIEELVKAAMNEKDIETAEEIAAYKNKLITNLSYRYDEWTYYLRKGLVKNKTIAPGTRLTSMDLGFSYIIVSDTGYVKYNENDHTYYFDLKGRLTGIRDKKGNSISIFYEENKLTPYRMQDNLGNSLHFIFNTNDLLEKIEAQYADGKKATSVCEFDLKNETLISSKDVGGNYYRYDWDNSFNLVKISYVDGTSLKIKYDPNTFFASEVIGQNGSRTEYIYPQRSDFDYGTGLTKYDSSGRKIHSECYGYVIKEDETGKHWTYKIITAKNDDTTIRIMNERYQDLDTIKLSDGVMYNVLYDKKGGVTEVHKNGQPFLTATIKKDAMPYSYTTIHKNTYLTEWDFCKLKKITLVKNGTPADKAVLSKEYKELEHYFRSMEYAENFTITE